MRRLGWMVVAGVLTWGTSPGVSTAQEPEGECHCVDGDGARIENCTCLRVPRFEGVALPFSSRPRLGLSVRADQGTSADASGARVAGVLQDGPAYEAGLREGDVITRLDGRSLKEPLGSDLEADFDLDRSLPVQRLLAVARELSPGQRVEIEYLRGEERRTARVEARELPPGDFLSRPDAERLRADTDRIREYVRGMRERMRGQEFGSEERAGPRERPGGNAGLRPQGRGARARIGLDLVELNEGLGEYFGTTRGVLVTAVDEGSALGLAPGDVILQIDGREASTPERVLSILGAHPVDEAITFRVRRGGREIDVSGRLGR